MPRNYLLLLVVVVYYSTLCALPALSAVSVSTQPLATAQLSFTHLTEQIRRMTAQNQKTLHHIINVLDSPDVHEGSEGLSDLVGIAQQPLRTQKCEGEKEFDSTATLGKYFGIWYRLLHRNKPKNCTCTDTPIVYILYNVYIYDFTAVFRICILFTRIIHSTL